MSNLWRFDFTKPKNPWAHPAEAVSAPGPALIQSAPNLTKLAQSDEAPDLDSMTDSELRARAKANGINVHHKSGRAKIMASLRGES
ncbi:MAG: hypothetical protein V4568_14660 [Pseudomonadota bacterium]